MDRYDIKSSIRRACDNVAAMLTRFEPSHEIIRTRRHTVNASEVEEVIKRHAFVDKAAVFGLFDLFEWSQVVYAIVAFKQGYYVTPQELLLYCKNHLNNSAVPQVIDIWDYIPLDACGRIEKGKLVSSYYLTGMFPPAA